MAGSIVELPVTGLLLAMALALAPAQATDNRRCGDDDGNDRCAPAVQAKMLASYRLLPITAYTKAEVRRILFVDGYGNDVVALEFVRDAGRNPVVRVHFRSGPGLPAIAPLETELTLGQWSDVLALSQDMEKSFVKSEAGNEPDESIICLHSWVYWGTAIDPGQKSRSVVDNSCESTPMETFAWQAAKMAIAAFPHCDLLDRKLGRNDAALLASCSGLVGDRITAARVYNEAKGFRFLDDKDGGKLADLAAYQMTLDLQGTSFSGKDATAAWDRFFADGKTYFYWDEVSGLTSESARVIGGVIRRGGAEDRSEDLRADAVIDWEEDGSVFEIKSITVGAFRPYRQQSN